MACSFALLQSKTHVPFLSDSYLIFLNKGVHESFEDQAFSYLRADIRENHSDLSVLSYYARYFSIASYLCSDEAEATKLRNYEVVLGNMALGFELEKSSRIQLAERCYREAFEEGSELIPDDSFKNELMGAFKRAVNAEKSALKRIRILREGTLACLLAITDDFLMYLRARIEVENSNHLRAFEILKYLAEKDEMWRCIAIEDQAFSSVRALVSSL